MPPNDPKASSQQLDESLPPSSGQARLSYHPSSAGARSEAASFAPGDLLANRFRVLRLISKGGMGEVYEAEDLELQERVAVKTVLPAIAGNPAAIEQFKREIHLARKVTHPNVCRIFDLVYDPRPSGPMAFLTMELLEGVPLCSHLEKAGTIALEEVVVLARQMAEGLHAAHQAGVIHQDFKSGNVMLVGGGEGGPQRVVITDFGLAHNLQAADKGSGHSAGTPAYMAPEQIEGGPISPATDVYAFGVVLYELATGHWPYNAKTREELQAKKLKEAPVLPTKYVPELPIRVERTLLRCLARSPQDRFQDPRDVVRALEPTRRRWPALAAAALLLALLAAVGGYQWRRMQLTHREPTVAVVGFKNNTGDTTYDWLATELSETLTTGLGSAAGLHTVSTDEVAQLKNELSVPPSQSLEREDLSEVRQALGADYLLLGSYTMGSGTPDTNLTLDLRLQDARGETVASIHESGSEAEYGKLVTVAAAEVRRQLGSTRLPDTESGELQNLYPNNGNARRLYFEALDKLRSLDAPAALELLKKAAAEEPDNVVLHSALADTWSRLKHDPEAAREAQRAADLARQAPLPFEYVVLAKARAEEMTQRWDAAINDYGLLFPRYPHLDYGLHLAEAQARGSHPKDALDTLDKLSKMPPPMGSDPRIEMARAKVYGTMNDFNSELKAAQAALQQAQMRNARMMQANAQLELCWAHRNLGHVEPAFAACNQAQNLFEKLGDNVSAAVALNNVATWLSDRGQYAQAKQLYDRVIQVNQAAGAQKDYAGVCVNAAKTLYLMGKPGEADTYIERALKAAVPIGDKYNEALARILKGDVLSEQGRITEAESEMRKALALAKEINDESTQATALSNLASYQAETDAQSALATYTQVLQLGRKNGEQSAVARCLNHMGDVLFTRGDLAAAEQRYQEALQIRTELKEKNGMALAGLSLAQVELELGNLAQAEGRATVALKDFHDQQDADSESEAASLLVKILAAQGKLDQAKTYVKRIQEIATTDPDVAFDNRLSMADYFSASGEYSEALQQLQSLPSEARKAGRNFTSLQARVALVKLQAGRRPAPELRKELSSIEAEARRAGFSLLIQRANRIRL
ncbi:MAG TPA: protein kinase [Terriglobales bacterium]|jgi:tetratricopeptide (TPR) repeat protein|nr:protein kinase [Terriglobales bacterium]